VTLLLGDLILRRLAETPPGTQLSSQEKKRQKVSKRKSQMSSNSM
jgi:hypothetical protein